MIKNRLRIFSRIYGFGISCAVKDLDVGKINFNDVMIKEHVVGDNISANLYNENRDLRVQVMHI